MPVARRLSRAITGTGHAAAWGRPLPLDRHLGRAGHVSLTTTPQERPAPPGGVLRVVGSRIRQPSENLLEFPHDATPPIPRESSSESISLASAIPLLNA